jgi:hypothetical protein
MAHVVLARERFEATRAAVQRLTDVQLAIMLEGDEWKPAQPHIHTSGTSDPTATQGVYRAETLPRIMGNLKSEEHELINYIGTTLALIESVRAGLGDKYANVLQWLYVDCMTWTQIHEHYGVIRSTGSTWRAIAFDWIDSIGIRELLRGEVEL